MSKTISDSSIAPQTSHRGLEYLDYLVSSLADIGCCSPESARRLDVAIVGWKSIDELLLAKALVVVLVRKLLPSVLGAVAQVFPEPDATALHRCASDCQVNGDTQSVANAIKVAGDAAERAGKSVESAILAAPPDETEYWRWYCANEAANGAANFARAVRSGLEKPYLAQVYWATTLAVEAVNGLSTGDSTAAAKPVVSDFVDDIIRVLIDLKCPGAANL